jgi:quercetin dioxygenase-like cupin family protein
MKQQNNDPDRLFDEPLTEALLEAQPAFMPPPERVSALRQRVLAVTGAAARAGRVEHLTIRGADGRWLPLLPGIGIKLLREDASTRSYLLRMAPGATLPAHDHSDDEECVVLEGDIRLGDVHARAGDYHLARSGLPHGDLRTDGGCLLFLRGQKHYPEVHAGPA